MAFDMEEVLSGILVGLFCCFNSFLSIIPINFAFGFFKSSFKSPSINSGFLFNDISLCHENIVKILKRFCRSTCFYRLCRRRKDPYYFVWFLLYCCIICSCRDFWFKGISYIYADSTSTACIT